MLSRRHPRATLPLIAGFAVACGGEAPPTAPDAPPPALAARSAPQAQAEAAVEAGIEAAIRGLLPQVERLADSRGVDVAPVLAHWYGKLDEATLGGTLVVFEDRGNKQIRIDQHTGIEWVPNDPRRFGGTSIGYGVFPVAAPPLSAADTEAAIDRAMSTWGSNPRCSNLTIRKVPIPLADIWHAAFLPLGPGVLAVTILFAFIDSNGNFTDLDGDRNLDYALAVTFYSSDFSWAIDANIDVETVALHEAGHGLSQAHFGKGFITLANGRGHLAPRAVMNVVYTGVQQSLTGTDLAGHCSIWGSWPNN